MFSMSLERIVRTVRSSRFKYAAILAILVLALVFSVVSASGPRRPPQPPQPNHPQQPGRPGMWGMQMQMPHWRPWYPMQPVPKIKIIAVDEDNWAAFETENFPEDQDFTVTMGKIYTRGVDGIVVGEFNSGDGSAQQLRYLIPAELQGQYRIAIRAQTDHQYPYYAFNWFYNTTAQIDTTTSAEEIAVGEAPVEESADSEAAEAPPVEEETTTEEGQGGAEEAQETTADSELTGVTWQWVSFTDPVQGEQAIDSPEQYTVEFTPEGLVSVKADCNNGSGTYIAEEGGGIDIAIGAVTLALCEPESLSDSFLQYLNDAAIYSFFEGDLLLDLPFDSGTLRFAAAGAAEAADTGEAETPSEADTAEETTEAETTEETTDGETAGAAVTGTVTYLQRIALPDDAVVTVQIQDTSLADAPAVVVGEQIIETDGQQVPIPYKVAYSPDDIQDNHTYTMSARIEDADGNLLFINDTAIPVITNDNPTEDVEIMTIQVSTGGAEESEATDEAAAEETEAADSEETMSDEPSLTSATWMWTQFTDPVQGELSIEDPSLYAVQFFEDSTIGITADCNVGTGTYIADEAGAIDITVGAVTLALCDEESLSDQFLQYLDAAVIYFFDEGDLLLDLPVDSGTLRFAANGAEADTESAVPRAVAVASLVPVGFAASGGDMDYGNGEESPVPTFTVCDVARNEAVAILTENFPADQEFKVQMGPLVTSYPQMPARPMPMPSKPMPNNQWSMRPSMGMGMQGMWQNPAPRTYVPYYYDVDTIETGQGGQLELKFEIPEELSDAYRISIMMRTNHRFPYISYNWFYNNDASVCNGVDPD
jgi:putative lipoprotein